LSIREKVADINPIVAFSLKNISSDYWPMEIRPYNQWM